MKKLIYFVVAVILIGTLVQCAPAAAVDRDVVIQSAPFIGLQNGDFDGAVTCGQIRKYGDVGLGTFNDLDGEMVILDGKVYQVKSDGDVYVVEDNILTPFVEVTFFEPDISLQINKVSDIAQLQKFLDEKLPTENTLYAIKIDGVFQYVKTMSVPKQDKPYPTLADAVKNQSEFEFNNIAGTMIGLRSPDYMGSMGVPGYHFHFLNADRKAGGHVLDCTLENLTAAVDSTNQFSLVIPDDKDFRDTDFSQSNTGTGKTE